MVKFRVSPRVAVMLALAYSVIYIGFCISVILGTILFIQSGLSWLAAAANAMLIVPSALFVLIWREVSVLKSKNYRVFPCCSHGCSCSYSCCSDWNLEASQELLQESEVKVMPHLCHKELKKPVCPSRFLSAFQLPFFPVRILSSIAVTMALCFLIMIIWWFTTIILTGTVNVLAPQVSVEGNPALTILRHFVNLWGVIGVVIVLVYYGLSQAQRHDWRGDTF